MKNLCLLVILATCSLWSTAQIQSYNKAIGIRVFNDGRFGNGAAFDFKTNFKSASIFAPIADRLAFEAFASVGGYVLPAETRFSTALTALIEPHKNIMDIGLSWYWGVGASVGFTNGTVTGVGSYGATYFGPKATGGFEYILPKHPWAFTLGWIAGVDFVPAWATNTYLTASGTASAIYLIGYNPR